MALLRTAAERTVNGLWLAIQRLIEAITPMSAPTSSPPLSMVRPITC